MRDTRIAFVAQYDAEDVRHWSGTPANMVGSLRSTEGCAVTLVSPLVSWWHRPYEGAVRRTQRLCGIRGLPNRSFPLVRSQAAIASSAIVRSGADVVLAPGTILMPFIRCPQPLVSWADATFASVRDRYDEFSRLDDSVADRTERMERVALERVSLAVFASSWAADEARLRYGLAADRTAVVPFGANLPGLPDESHVDEVLAARASGSCRLLFIGRDWLRKGGDLALEVAAELHRRGVRTDLRVVGCRPYLSSEHADYTSLIGPLDKASASGYRTLIEELCNAHFLIVPSRQECYGIVFVEANAYGVPSLARAVGGVPDIIRTGRNGALFSLDDTADRYADFIQEHLGDREAYETLARSSWAEYASRLDWAVGSRALVRLLDGVVRRGRV